MSGTNHLFSELRANWTDLDKVALETNDGRQFRYRDILALTARFANALVAAGVKPGDRVAVQVEKSPEALFLYLACVRAGAAYLPLNTAYTDAELEYFLGDAEPTVFVARPTHASAPALCTKTGVARCYTLGTDGDGTLIELAAGRAETFENIARGPDDLAAILYTSGTTGRSKGAMTTHENLASNARALAEYWRFTDRDVLLHALPIFHTHGLFVASNVIFRSGASMLFLPKFDPNEVFRLLPRATAMMGVPTFYTRLIDDARLSRDTTKDMRLFISGSAPLLADTHRAFEEKTGHRILERYGMTETNMITSNPYDGERVPGAVGFPLPGVSVRIANPETGELLGADEIGMIEVKGPNVFIGYWRMPEKTASEFRDGWFITGDLGKIDATGYVHIVGRGKDLVITGGYNVYPKEVESEIDALPGVFESAVIGVPHPDFGEGVVAVVVKTKDAAIDEKAIHDALKVRLANYKLPKRVFFVDDLPRNTMAKVQKNVLRDTHKDLFS
ncbi:malonyl-CoA synthase [Rhodomicrobium vannielii ATCC 17100]|uniref:malonate--CoA ligase n=1 Tax=Rhodomicrobium vannielii TaxID=1069 RepID=UPI001918039E|nr:malonyl-CoA synthase [Rhodomicrobium vannielii]MBJ7533513.1 malonyl-CoA synthase [Rhodomicrobium vannielii ATCC 17100]